MDIADLERSKALLEEENSDLKSTVEELTVLNDISTAVSSAQSLEQIESLIIYKCNKHLKAEEGIVMLLIEDNDNRPFETVFREGNILNNSLPYRLDDQLMGRMLEYKSAIIINDFNNNEYFDTGMDDKSVIRSLLCVPMFIKGKMIGLIAVFNKMNEEGFTNKDQRLLAICASQVGQVIENARLYKEEHKLLKIREEIQIAKKIQNNLLPENLYKHNGYTIIGRSIQAIDVGGDFYDFIPITKDNIAICLGDITGKGIPAALIMANLHAILRTQSILNSHCSDCLTRSNQFLFDSTDADKFATLFYSILNPINNTFQYCSAGHELALHISKDKHLTRLATEDIALGINPNYSYSEKTIQFDPDDIIIIYSDGISEAENNFEEQFGEKRLIEVVQNNLFESPVKILEEVLSEVEKFTSEVPQFDDQTIVLVKREKMNSPDLYRL